MNKDKETLKEIVAVLPLLQSSFKVWEREYTHFKCYQWKENVTKQTIADRNKTLLQTVKDINAVDLKILYYIQHLEGRQKMRICKKLAALYQAQCALKSELGNNTQEYYDPFFLKK